MLVRPKYITDFHIHNLFKDNFNFKDQRVLDFGCGIGTFCTLFDPSYYLGLDPDAKRINYARRSYSGYNFSVLTGYQLPVSSRSLDYILISAVLHHIPTREIQYYLLEFKRVLKPWGKIIVTEPCFYQHTAIKNWFMQVLDNGKYIRDEESYLGLFTASGFQVQVIKRFRKLLYNELFFLALPN